MTTATNSGPVPEMEVSDSAEPIENEQDESYLRRRFLFFQAAPSWLVSTLIHVLILMVLGLVTIADPVKVVNVLTAINNADGGPEVEEFTIEVLDPGDVAEMEEMSESVADVGEPMETIEPAAVEAMEMATVAVEIIDMAADMAPTSMSLQTLSSMTAQPLSSRSQDMKNKLLRDYGGSESSEAAVTQALKWLSRHQMPNGAWTFQHDLVCKGACGDPGAPEQAQAFNAATSLALLPFLGAGQTQNEGSFRKVVQRGLRFLVQNGKAGKKGGLPVLDLSEPGGNMYSHGLAAITLCEAYVMTEDPELALPAQAALNFIVKAQCRDGGWRYIPKQPDGGDTSVTGWQIMALKSGYMGRLSIPPATFKRSKMFLDKVQSNDGSMYGYTSPPKNMRPANTAIGLLCRMYTGWDKNHPGIVQGVKNISEVGLLKNDIYYDYYAAQVLRHYGGAEWHMFNIELRDWLVQTQSTRAGERGSWHFPDSRSHRGPKEGGRLASTAFATMILEVYYRHMPLYADAAASEDFPL